MIDREAKNDHIEGDSPYKKEGCDVCGGKGYYTMPGFEQKWIKDKNFPFEALHTVEVLKKVPCKCGRKYEKYS